MPQLPMRRRMKYRMLSMQKGLMIMSATWNMKTRSIFKRYLFKGYSIFIITYYHIFCQALLINALVRLNCRMIFHDLIGHYVNHTTSAVINTFSRRKAMKRVWSYIYHYEEQIYPKERQSSKRIYDYYAKINIIMGKYPIILLSFSSCLVIYITDIASVLTNTENIKINNITSGETDCFGSYGVIYKVWYPFSSNLHWLRIVCDLLMYSLAMCMHMYNRIYSISMAVFALAQMKILENLLRNVDNDAKEMHNSYNIAIDEAVEVCINHCIRRHQEIISFMDQFHKATKETMLIGYFSNSIEVAIFLIQLLIETQNSHTIKIDVRGPGILLQIFIFFWFANEVYLESNAIADVIYHEMKWMTYKNSIQKKLLLIMVRCQKPLAFKGIVIGEITIEKYKQILKSCYSILAFVQTMYGTKV